MTQPNPTNEDRDMPDLVETHLLVDIPNWGKAWVVKDILEYYGNWEAYTAEQVRLARVDELKLLTKEVEYLKEHGPRNYALKRIVTLTPQSDTKGTVE